jgi:hypothetical protein
MTKDAIYKHEHATMAKEERFNERKMYNSLDKPHAIYKVTGARRIVFFKACFPHVYSEAMRLQEKFESIKKL